MAFTLSPLPFEFDALEPHLSRETLEYHHGKHHQAYVNNLNNLIANTEWETRDLETIIKTAQGGIFNNAAQIWNHNFYWQCLTPNQTEPSAALLSAIERDFVSFAAFKESFTKTALTTFGSGWAWLVKNSDGSLEILSTSNAGTPLQEAGKTPLLTCDVWEHAYYVDYRNARPTYVDAFWNMVNWAFVESQFAK